MVKGIHHIGIVVTRIDDVLPFLQEAFGAEEERRIEIPMAKQISSLVRIGESFLELIEPTDPSGTAGKFLRSKGGGLHHISLNCDDAKAECDTLEQSGLKILRKESNGKLKGGFIHPKSSIGILFELTEE